MRTCFLIISISIVLLIFSGCKKYDEGPFLTLRTPEKRIEGSWTVNLYSINDNDSLNLLNNHFGNSVSFSIAKPGSGQGQDHINIGSLQNEISGYFHFIDDDENLTMQFLNYNTTSIDNLGPINSNTYSTWNILKLTKKEFRLETNFENIDYKLILIRK